MTITQTPVEPGASAGPRMARRTLRALAAPLAVAGGLAIAAPMVAAPAAFAAPLMAYAPTPLSASIGVIGNRVYVTVSASGFTPNATVTVSLGSTILGTTTANGSGSFSFTGPLPTGLTAGNYTIVASGGGPSASTVIYLSAGLPGVVSPATATATVTPAAPSSGGLAFTGADETLTAAAGALAIGGGGMLVLASRKRKRNAWSA